MVKKYSSIVFIIVALYCVCHLVSCNLINPPETIPAYGHVDSVGLTTNSATQGTASHNVSCAWVYVDDQPVGTFALTNTFPIIASNGSHTISIIPGVTVNGQSSTREQYPFYTPYNGTVNLTQGSVSHFAYTATYLSTTKFRWLEDFDNGASFSITTDKSRTVSDSSMFRVGPPSSFQGNSGEVVLDSTSQHNHVQFLGYSDTMTLPAGGVSLFLEMNYNANAVFGVGVAYGATYNSSYLAPILVDVYPSNGWQKMYIDLGPAVADQQPPYIIYFYFQRPPGQQQATLLLDNIKVLHL
jgi:hypothetical protein